MTRQPSGVYGGGTADESAATAQTPLSETGASRCRPVIPGRVAARVVDALPLAVHCGDDFRVRRVAQQHAAPSSTVAMASHSGVSICPKMAALAKNVATSNRNRGLWAGWVMGRFGGRRAR